MAKTTTPYGHWQSPITAKLAATHRRGGHGNLVCSDDYLYWLESRPHEGGRHVIMRASPDNEIEQVTVEGYNVRSRVHEYGGGDFWVHDYVVYFVNDKDQRIYRQTQTEKPVAITPEPDIEKSICYADGIVTHDGEKIICVREQHRNNKKVENDLIEITVKTGEICVLESGADFYASPRLSHDGKLAFICWHHPHMPWDGSELWIRQNRGEKEKIAGGPNESIYQPEFFNDDIYYVSDRSGYWNIYKNHENICEMQVEMGLPQWVFGTNTYTIINDESVACIITDQGERKLALLKKDDCEYIPLAWREFGPNLVQRQNELVFSASSPHEVAQLVTVDMHSQDVNIIQAKETPIKQAYLSQPEAIQFPTSNHDTAHAFYYPPKNDDMYAPNEAPPLIVLSHGGPTASTSLAFNADIQFWTSRGFAVVDVNYRGSTGYGREYRDALKTHWGIYDVDDCKAAADYLVRENKANPNALIIKGRSAGGYTTLAALTFTDTFSAGASYYGISDLELIANDTHKFELHYCDSLVGKYPDEKATYQARSPIHFPEKLSCPIIFLQGLEDKVVPPAQAENMIEKLKTKGLAYDYVTFENEGHGFRDAKNLMQALEAELGFYLQHVLADFD